MLRKEGLTDSDKNFIRERRFFSSSLYPPRRSRGVVFSRHSSTYRFATLASTSRGPKPDLESNPRRRRRRRRSAGGQGWIEVE